MTELRQATFTIEDVRQALTNPLPGVRGQLKMAPAPIEGRPSRWELPEYCREASVLILLYPHTNYGGASETYLVLMRRPDYPGAHSGQVSFPGGQREQGESLEETALRETTEEIGVYPETLKMIGQLSSLYTPPSNFCIYPFVAFSTARPTFALDAREVAELIEAPLGLLASPATRKEEVWHFENYGARQIPFFEVFGHKVWGATAMILSEFLTLLAM